MDRLLLRAFAYWLPLAVALTGIFGFAYLAVQQDYRQSVNDPQIQMAEDVADSLEVGVGGTPESVVLPSWPLINMARSLAPWTAVYDASGTLIRTNGVLDNSDPSLPSGLFDTSTWSAGKTWQAVTGPETRITWQPSPGVRQAVVLVQFKTSTGVGYVAVGRSMKTVKDRIINLTELVAIAWSVTALASFVVIFLLLSFGWL